MRTELHQARRDRILEVAAATFAEFGYERTKVETLAHDAQVSTATVYNYFQTAVVQHAVGNGDVFRFAAVRCAREGELVIAPPQLLEAADLEQRHRLEGLGARAPRRSERRIMRSTDKPVRCVDDRGVHPMMRFDEVAARDHHIELEALHVVAMDEGGVAGGARRITSYPSQS